MTLYRTAAGRRRIHALYDRAVERLGLPIDERTVDTDHGPTHLLLAGPADAPPVVVLQGGNSLNPLCLAWYRPLADRFRLLAPDTPGHPGKSAERRPSWGRRGYGRWLVSLLDALDLERPPMVGSSHGAAVALQAASLAPGRVGPTVLAFPMGVTNPRIRTLAGLAPAALLERVAPSRRRLRAAAETLFTEPLGELWLDMVAAVAEHVRFEMLLPRAVPRRALEGWDAPALLFASGRDALFPPDRLVARARRLVPRLEEAVRMEGQDHVPGRAGLEAINRRIVRFLSG